MARKKIEVKCPYCEGVYAASGMTAHVRHKHPGEYEEFKANRQTIIEKNTVGADKPASPRLVTQEVEEPVKTPVSAAEPEPEKTPTPAPKEQKTDSFLGSIGKALRDW